jgi:acyl dehydratase
MSAAGPRPERYWEDVAPGEALPGFALDLTMTRMVLQVSGTQDFYPVHHDTAFARAGGHRDIFLNTYFLRGCLCRLLTDWMGPDGFLRRLAFQMRRPNFLGETIAVRGRVSATGPDPGRVDLEVWVETLEGGVTVPATATVILPRRG